MDKSVHPLRVAAAVVMICALIVVGYLNYRMALDDPCIGSEDAAAYALLARSLSEGRGLEMPSIWHHVRPYGSVVHQEDYWPPLQAVITAGAFALFEVDTATAKMVNVAAYLLLVILAWLAGSWAFTPRIGLLAAAVCLASADLHVYAYSARNDIIQTLLTLLGVWCLARLLATEIPQRRYAMVAGVAVGLALLQKPLGLLLCAAGVAAFLIKAVYEQARRPGLFKAKRQVAALVIFAFFFVLLSAPYTLRNYSLYGTWLSPLGASFHSISVKDYVEGNVRDIESDLTHKPIFKRLFPIPDNGDYYKPEVPAFAKLRYGVNELVILGEMIRHNHIVPVVFLFLALFAWFVSSNRGRAFAAVFVLYSAATILVVSFHVHTEQRYYLFWIPLTAVLACGALGWMGKRSSERKDGFSRWSFAGYAVLVAGFLCFSFLLPAVQTWAEKRQQTGMHSEFLETCKALNETLPDDAVLLTWHPLRVAWHAGRPTVLLPNEPTETICRLVWRYGVTHVILPDGASGYPRLGGQGIEEMSGWGTIVDIPHAWVVRLKTRDLPCGIGAPPEADPWE
ncbi:MAG: ArnT family glycosyltransferase [Desulfatibacillaceae bacterium]